MKLNQPFTEAQSKAAYDEWGANCGPNALAACLDITLDALRPRLVSVEFEKKRYMSPTMMSNALKECGAQKAAIHPSFKPEHGLCRIQWHGPWTDPGMNPRWAYGHTHWIHVVNGGTHVFDCNGGWRTFESWEKDIAPLLAAQAPRRYGTWSITHSWEVVPA